MENKLINAYENLSQSSEQLIKLQKERIVELETKLVINRQILKRLCDSGGQLLQEYILLIKKHNYK
jgi:hypothetical protein